MQGIFHRRTGWQLHSEPHSPMTLARITAMCNHIALSHVGGCCVHETCGISGLHVVHGEFLEVRDPVLGSVSRTMVLWSYVLGTSLSQHNGALDLCSEEFCKQS